MAKKINIDNVITEIDNARSTKIILNLDIRTERQNSDVKIDNKFAGILEHFLPLWICVVSEYYFLEKDDDTISDEASNEIRKFRQLLINKWLKEHEIKYEAIPEGHIETDEESKIRVLMMDKQARTLFDRFPLGQSKKGFLDKNGVMANDATKSHLNAFNVSSQSKLPTKNILMKFTDGVIHLRMGIKKETKERTLTIVKIVEKKAKN